MGHESEKSAEQQKQLANLLFSLKQQQKTAEKLSMLASENQARGEWVYAHYTELLEIRKALAVARQKGVPSETVLEKFRESRVVTASQLIALDKSKTKATFEV